MSLYSEALKHPKWQRRRLYIFKRDGWRCTKCGNGERELHAHHKYYLPDRAPWEYPYDAIVTLCSDCHYMEHAPTLNPDSRRIKHISELIIEYISIIRNGK